MIFLTHIVFPSFLLSYFRLGGPDPLDYISMYLNEGDPENGIAPHWHYVSFGLSDLHGDGRVHPYGFFSYLSVQKQIFILLFCFINTESQMLLTQVALVLS